MASNTRSSRRSEPEPKQEKSSPIFSRRVWTGTGSVEICVWDKMIDGDDGEFRVFNIVAKRCWKEDNDYKSGNAFRPEDLLPLALFLQEAASFVISEQSRK